MYGMVEDGREQLGRQIGERRRQLGLSVRAAAQRAGVDRATWTAAENGTRTIAEYNHAGVERALDWEQGTIARVLAGGAPNPTNHALQMPPLDADLAAEVRRIQGLPYPAAVRLIMLRALIDLHAEAADEGRETPNRRAG